VADKVDGPAFESAAIAAAKALDAGHLDDLAALTAAETGVLAEGNWNYRMVATAQDGTPFKQRVIIHVKR